MRRGLGILVVGWVFTLSVHAATQLAPVRIGVLLPPEETEAESLRRGTELAIEWANRSNTPAAEWVIRGRAGQWGDDGVEAGRMVLDDSVAGLVAPSGGVPTHLALQIGSRTATPVISLCGDSSVTEAGIPWSARIVPRTADEVGAILTGLGTNCRHWAAFVPEDRAGRQRSRDITAAAALIGRECVSIISVDPARAADATLLSRLPHPWPDGLLIWLDTLPAARLAKCLRAASFKGVLAGPARLRAASFEALAGCALEEFMSVEPRLDNTTANLVRRFENDYERRFGAPPDLEAAMTFDAVSLLVRFARESGDDPMRGRFPIADAGMGVTGSLRFDHEGNRLLPLELIQFRSGGWTTCPVANP